MLVTEENWGENEIFGVDLLRFVVVYGLRFFDGKNGADS
jgi:hypothetical protein